jgi:hypothetical protein
MDFGASSISPASWRSAARYPSITCSMIRAAVTPGRSDPARRSCQEQGQSDEIVGRISDDGLIKIADLNGNPSVRRSDRA